MSGIKRIIILVAVTAYSFIVFSAMDIYKEYSPQTADTCMENTLIVIDPGHGGVDGGASLSENFNEKDINLDISLKLRDRLVNDGAKVIMTREGDVSLDSKSDLKLSRYRKDLDGRRRIINSSNADVFVSMHSNCFRSDPRVKGAIIFYSTASEKSKELAQSIASSINEILYGRFLGDNTLSAKVLTEDLFILRNAVIPGVLIEAGYMSNYEEGRLLVRDDFQAAMAEAIHFGLKYYFINHSVD